MQLQLPNNAAEVGDHPANGGLVVLEGEGEIEELIKEIKECCAYASTEEEEEELLR